MVEFNHRQAKFIQSIARAAGASPADVTIDNVEAIFSSAREFPVNYSGVNNTTGWKRRDLAEEEEKLLGSYVKELGYVIGGDDHPEVRALLMDVFSEEAEEDPMLSNMGWENELLRDVFAQNPLTRKSSGLALQPGAGASLVEMEGEESWELEMRNLFAQSPLTRPREADEAARVDDETRA